MRRKSCIFSAYFAENGGGDLNMENEGILIRTEGEGRSTGYELAKDY